MFNIYCVLNCLFWNLRMLRKNPRLIMSLFMGFLICFLLTEKTISLSYEFLTDIQIFEPFIWCFADSDSILFVSLALILLLSRIPQMDASAAYLVFRANRLNWLLGQVLTAVVVSIGYTLFIFLSSVVLSASNGFLANRWSDTATLLSFSPASFEVALNVVRKTIKLTKPYSCTIHIFFLMAQYSLMLTALNLAASLRYGRKAGMSAMIYMSLLAYLLTPDRFMVWLQLNENLQYYANILAAWLSPLQQATYIMHNFGYDQLPTIAQSHFIFSIINLMLITSSFFSVQRVQFTFLGGNPND